jgi:hypothetical protein
VIGTMVLGAAFAYVAAFYFLAKHAPTRALKIAAIVIGVAIPFWDLPIGYVNYRLQCYEHGGLQIFGDPPSTESILIDRGIGYRPDYLAKYGFKKIEYVTTPARVATYTITKQGIEKSDQANPTSAYKISHVGNQPAGWSVIRRELTLSRLDSGKVIARHSEFFWNGMWWQTAIAPGGTDVHCHAGQRDHEEFLRFASKGIR